MFESRDILVGGGNYVESNVGKLRYDSGFWFVGDDVFCGCSHRYVMNLNSGIRVEIGCR